MHIRGRREKLSDLVSNNARRLGNNLAYCPFNANRTGGRRFRSARAWCAEPAVWSGSAKLRAFAAVRAHRRSNHSPLDDMSQMDATLVAPVGI